MAFLGTRPRPYQHDYDATDYQVSPIVPESRTWNPRSKEVIVIEDSPSPRPALVYHDRNSRQDVSSGRHVPANAGAMSWNRQTSTLHNSFHGENDLLDCYGVPSLPDEDYILPNTSMASQLQYSNPLAHLYMRPEPNLNAHTNGKRKREEPSHRRIYNDYNKVLALRKAERTLNKDREVVLRKEFVSDSTITQYQPFDDKEGHYRIVPNTDLTHRYVIDKLLGQGTFGKVVRAFDRHSRTWVAIKIIRAIQKYRDASMIELRVLRTLQENDPHNANNCIHLRDCFDFRNHVCIVTELLNESIFDFLKSNQFSPFPMFQIQHFAKQLFTSVAFLHDLDLIHTDLKPENILLVDNDYIHHPYNGKNNTRTRKVLKKSDLRLIDFGSATFQDEYHSNVVSTRHYRAPEIILGMGWSFPCDIWSIGCILIEFFTGEALYQTHDNLEHLAMMEVVCGRIDGRIIRQCSKTAQKLFRPSGRLDYPNNETARDSRKFMKNMKRLSHIIPATSELRIAFADLLKRIFTYSPEERITARQALAHSFFYTLPP